MRNLLKNAHSHGLFCDKSKKRIVIFQFLIVVNFMFCSNRLFFFIFADFLGKILKKPVPRYVLKTIRSGIIQRFLGYQNYGFYGLRLYGLKVTS